MKEREQECVGVLDKERKKRERVRDKREKVKELGKCELVHLII